NDCRAARDTIFVCGDNMLGQGRGGQAGIRDESNAPGIPNKWKPSMHLSAFFSDACLAPGSPARTQIDQQITALRLLLRSGSKISLPADGIGTGLAELPRRAPALHAYIEQQLAGLSRLVPIVPIECKSENKP